MINLEEYCISEDDDFTAEEIMGIGTGNPPTPSSDEIANQQKRDKEKQKRYYYRNRARIASNRRKNNLIKSKPAPNKPSIESYIISI